MSKIPPDRLLSKSQFVFMFKNMQVVDVLIVELVQEGDPLYALGIRSITSERVFFIATKRGTDEPRQWATIDAVATFLKRDCSFRGACRLILGPNALAPRANPDLGTDSSF